MKKTDWGLEIIKVENGFLIKSSEGHLTVVEDKSDEDQVSVSAIEELLHHIVEFFNLSGSRYDRERIFVTSQVGDKYEPKPNEKIVKDFIYKLQPKIKPKDIAKALGARSVTDPKEIAKFRKKYPRP